MKISKKLTKNLMKSLQELIKDLLELKKNLLDQTRFKEKLIYNLKSQVEIQMQS